MDFRILGPVEVIKGGRRVALGPRKQRALLVLLLLHVNEVVSRDRLIDDLWGERAPETAATSLHGYVSQLRKLLEEGNGAEPTLLLTRAPGYRLALDPEQVDLNRFELLARRGKRELAVDDAAAAAATLAEALSLWRGPPLAEFDSAPFTLAESLRLEELRVAALEDRIEADLALGRHRELVEELEMLAREYPYRERLDGQLMLSLYRSGRQAEALEAYRQTRHRLVEELGLEPGRELQELEQAILTHNPSLQAPPHPAAGAGTVPGRSTLRRWPKLAVATVVALGLTLGVALWLDDTPPGSIRLAADSVGFIDAKSGRIIRSYAVGRQPIALTVADNAVWVANYQDGTVTRIDRSTGRGVTIPIGRDLNPTGIAAYRGKIWVWTQEGFLVWVDPRYDRPGNPVSFADEIIGRRAGGRIAAGGGYLWITAPGTTVIRVDADNIRIRKSIVPDDGVQGAIVYRDSNVWVGGSDQVFPIAAETRLPGPGIRVGVVRDLAFGAGSLWVLSGHPGHVGGIVQALRRVDSRSGLLQTTIAVGADPVAVALAGGSVWVADRSDRLIQRVDPVLNRRVAPIAVGAQPTALVSEHDGIWVAASDR
jgi:DNA-binding SARP family transcriptional activator/streptogramin lyase